MRLSPDLIAQAVDFRDRIASLLNRSIATNAHIAVLFDERNGQCRIAPGISAMRMAAVPIPLGVGDGQPSCYLDLTHRLTLDPEGKYLTDALSWYGVYRDADLRQPLFKYDYDRGNDPHSEVHLHVRGTFLHGSPPYVRPLDRLHFPMGGRRFRVTLEDVIEFLVSEHFAQAKDGWKEAISEHRSHWNELQVKAAVRRYPDAALEILREMHRL